MPDDLDPVERAQRAILDHYPAQLSERELSGIVAEGVLHERGGFYWPSRAATHAVRLRAE